MDALPIELTEAIVGSLFLAIGLAAAVAGLAARPRRDAATFWFGVFCLLYGVRLCAKSALIQALTPWPGRPFNYVDAFVTYSILIPGGLFTEGLVGPGRYKIIRRIWQITCVCAAAAMVNDLTRGQPYASMWANPPIVLVTLFVQLAHVVAHFWRERWSIELRAVMATGALLTFIAVAETVSQQGLFGGRFDVEPLAMLLFLSALGWFLLARARDQAYQFIALSRELELARNIQRSLLPKDVPRVPGLRIQGTYLPMSAVAGDFYDVAAADGRVLVIVADVSGHGVPAALIASMVKIAFAAESERAQRPGEILTGINRTLAGKFEHAYVTACCALIDRPQKTIAYAAAGHPPALLRRRDGRIERIEEGGIVLTLVPTAAYDTVEVPFHPGDRLLLFTDGLLEAARSNDDDDFFGDTELARVVGELPESADASVTVLRAHRDWIGSNASLSDDVTLVVVECIGVGELRTA